MCNCSNYTQTRCAIVKIECLSGRFDWVPQNLKFISKVFNQEGLAEVEPVYFVVIGHK